MERESRHFTRQKGNCDDENMHKCMYKRYSYAPIYILVGCPSTPVKSKSTIWSLPQTTRTNDDERLRVHGYKFGHSDPETISELHRAIVLLVCGYYCCNYQDISSSCLCGWIYSARYYKEQSYISATFGFWYKYFDMFYKNEIHLATA